MFYARAYTECTVHWYTVYVEIACLFNEYVVGYEPPICVVYPFHKRIVRRLNE
jgi:hypothetical protein